jgi:hypothetical protein
MSALHTLLNVEQTVALTLRAVAWLDWGQTLVFDISTETAGTFALRFDDCREMRWRIYAHETTGDHTPIVDFAAGRDAHRSPAQVLTERFGLSLVYGKLGVSRTDAD